MEHLMAIRQWWQRARQCATMACRWAHPATCSPRSPTLLWILARKVPCPTWTNKVTVPQIYRDIHQSNCTYFSAYLSIGPALSASLSLSLLPTYPSAHLPSIYPTSQPYTYPSNSRSTCLSFLFIILLPRHSIRHLVSPCSNTYWFIHQIEHPSAFALVCQWSSIKTAPRWHDISSPIKCCTRKRLLL